MLADTMHGIGAFREARIMSIIGPGPRKGTSRGTPDFISHDTDRWALHVHVFDAREGGLFRISFTYDEPTGTGKTTKHTDTYHGHFVKLVPNEQVVEVMEFESADAPMYGEMTVTFTLTDVDGGTGVFAVHDNLPPGVSPVDNETGWRMALEKLAAFVEAEENKEGPVRHGFGDA
jgi:uncharacterized protein YndB with AHSA1/START domain